MKRKIIPVSIYGVAALESWLSDMAAQGLFLKKFGRLFAQFEEGEPQTCRYRFEPITKESRNKEAAIISMYEDFGWHYVTNLNQVFRLFMTIGSGEIHTDPVLEGETYDQLNRMLKKSALWVTIGVLLIAVMMFSIYIFNDEPILYFVTNSQSVNQMVLVFLEISVAVSSLRDFLAIRRLRAQLEEGRPFAHETNYRAKTIVTVSWQSLMLLISVAVLVLPFCGIAKRWDENLVDFQGNLPAISLLDIENDSRMVRDEDVFYNGKDYHNHVDYDWSLLAPEQYEINESGRVSGEMWEDGSGEYTPNITTYYYRLAIPALAKPMMEDLVHKHITWRPDNVIQFVDALPFDDAVFAVGSYEDQYLAAYYDNIVIFISYQGRGDLRQHFDEILSAAKAFSEN